MRLPHCQCSKIGLEGSKCLLNEKKVVKLRVYWNSKTSVVIRSQNILTKNEASNIAAGVPLIMFNKSPIQL